MATPASRLIQDQNLSILSNGSALGGKTGATKADKKGRKALNDISNSRNATLLQTKKDNSINTVLTRKDQSSSKTKSAVGEKVGGRKALGDLTNSVKLSSQVVPNKCQKLNPVDEESEGFLHDHRECIKAQRKAVDVDRFLKSVGLKNDNPMLPSSPSALVPSSKPMESPVKQLEMEELPYEDQVCRRYSSPSWGSPKSPKLPFKNWKEENFSDFMLMVTPKLLNP